MTIKIVEGSSEDRDTEHYVEYAKAVTERLTGKHLFMVNISKDEFWKAYLSGFPMEEQQYYNCNCCKSFITSFGRLVYFDRETKRLVPAMWELGVSTATDSLFNALSKKLNESSDIAIATVAAGECGHFELGGWNHYSFTRQQADACVPYPHLDGKDAKKLIDYATSSGVELNKINAFVESVINLQGLPENICKSAKTLGEFYNEYYELLGDSKHELAKRDIEWHLVAKYNGFLHHFWGSALGEAYKDFTNYGIPSAMATLQNYTDDLKYRRPVESTDANQLAVAARYLKDNDWMSSLSLKPLEWDEEFLGLFDESELLYAKAEEQTIAQDETTAEGVLDALLGEKVETKPEGIADVYGEKNIRLDEFLALLESGTLTDLETKEVEYISFYRRLPEGVKNPFKPTVVSKLLGICYVNLVGGKQLPTFKLQNYGVVSNGWVKVDRVYQDLSNGNKRIYTLFKGNGMPTEHNLGYIPTEDLCGELYPYRRTIHEIGTKLKPKVPVAPVVGWDVEISDKLVGTKLHYRGVVNQLRQTYVVIC